ncbi:hypothetical protein [Levilactobacillus phage ENFP1]|nr:hypothetical protein [Levilactobacillus phage ENFP1]
MKAKNIEVGDKLYRFAYDNVYNKYEYAGAYTVTKLTTRRVYLGNIKLERKGSFPLVDSLGGHPWLPGLLSLPYDRYSPDKDWNVKEFNRLQENKKLEGELQISFGDIEELFMGSSASDKKRILESLKDIN